MMRKLQKFFSKQQRIVIRTLIISSILLYILQLNWNSVNNISGNDFLQVVNKGENRLEDIVFGKHQPEFGRSIFFIESSNAITLFPSRPELSAKEVKLNARQACAIESAVKMNPNTDVFVLFVGDSFRVNITDQPILKAILTYPNVHLRKLNLWTYVVGTPVYEWFKTGKLFTSKYPVEHISDFLRLLTLWRWGGTYFDLDVIILKSMENIPPNYACWESNIVANGVMNFDSDGFGHEVVDLCLRDFQKNFNGNIWGQNGPLLITKVLQEICQANETKTMTRERCNGFNVYPRETFYAIHYGIWNYFFDSEHLDEVMRKINQSLVVHFWNKLSSRTPVKVGSNVAYEKLAEQYCPKVYDALGEYF